VVRRGRGEVRPACGRAGARVGKERLSSFGLCRPAPRSLIFAGTRRTTKRGGGDLEANSGTRQPAGTRSSPARRGPVRVIEEGADSGRSHPTNRRIEGASLGQNNKTSQEPISVGHSCVQLQHGRPVPHFRGTDLDPAVGRAQHGAKARRNRPGPMLTRPMTGVGVDEGALGDLRLDSPSAVISAPRKPNRDLAGASGPAGRGPPNQVGYQM